MKFGKAERHLRITGHLLSRDEGVVNPLLSLQFYRFVRQSFSYSLLLLTVCMVIMVMFSIMVMAMLEALRV